jgi:hypothetical protein
MISFGFSEAIPPSQTTNDKIIIEGGIILIILTIIFK